MILNISMRESIRPEMRPIARDIFKHEQYEATHKRLYEELKLDKMAVFERWETHKEIIREAATLEQAMG